MASCGVLGCFTVLLAALISCRYYENITLFTASKVTKTANETNWLKDWNNYAAIEAALNSTGLGEVGRPANLEEYRKELYNQYGFDAILSDYISVNRTVPDIRPHGCKIVTYLSKLPKTAVIIIFYNERLSVLLRTIHGILNRTPDELIQEIILVDDCSPWPELHTPLTDYMNLHFPPDRSKVRLLRLPGRGGLIVARMAGARAASKESEVLIFLDSHFEVNHNWLPPLLEPIVHNPKACTIPAIDTIAYDTFQYKFNQPFRGYFRWDISYMQWPLLREEKENSAENFNEYVMMGNAMALSKKFFWNLGGFDDGMTIWGGEQLEMSFKIWMCGGELISVPCSRLGHLFRDPETKGNTNLYGNYSFLNNNYRRLVDVWFDEEHRQYVIEHRPDLKNANPGDLSDRIAIRERLHCKSFSWMLDTVMPDLKEVFPPVEPGDNGFGTISSKIHPNACIALNNEEQVVLADCNDETNFANWQKFWHYTWRCELRTAIGMCLESDITNNRVIKFLCHITGGNQRWYYDEKRQWIVQLEYNFCMMANAEDMRVDLFQCDENNLNMKWVLGTLNQRANNKCALAF